MIQLAEKRMKEILREQGLSILGIRVVPRNESDIVVKREGTYVSIPLLYLMTGEDEYNRFRQEGYSNITLPAWREAVRETGLPFDDYYDNEMHIGADNVHREYYEMFAREQKTQIGRYLYKTLRREPWMIYASSSPGVNIIYETEDYKELKIEERREKLSEDICRMAAEYVKEQYGEDIPCLLSVRFYHPEQKGFNGYGLSRED